MEVCNPKGGRTATPATLLMMMMMVLNAYCSSAAALAKSNTSFRCSSGRLDECRLIEEDLELELELEFLMNPYESRILAVLQESDSSHPNSNNPNSPACGKPQDGTSSSRCIARQKLKSTDCVETSPYKRFNLKPRG
ncbi:hypothetical protein I3843_03G116600 [Carya illinoinensis]|uniref:Uncharacterized protein n=1 Tax=Carya illinoinensis TaxID=32201 RepID=A0A922IU24_CARIL|nr:hypothetical protein I3842_13G159500 [Carya illinoinensis]KAG7987115.1 hypothetical protein I3843_03G116600 [Carya illinoinensis]